MRQGAKLHIQFVARLSFGAKLLLSLWGLFFILVACGVHGSSTPVSAGWWSPETPYSGYVFNRLISGDRTNNLWRELLMAQARSIRSDEWVYFTPQALSQLSQVPRFPVVNSNICDGQNMLVFPYAPVYHISTLARPATWGYFILGAQRGLAWQWWFHVFSCFTVLYLLLCVILDGHHKIAAFGAFWFSASAYVVCWSLWPAYIVFFAALACLSGYHLLRSDNPGIQIISGALLGLALPGFLMTMYPAWQVALGYLFLFLFIGLVCRDRLYRSLFPISRYRAFALAIALLLSAIITIAFITSLRPALDLMAATVYPAKRVSLGGDYSLWQVFKGVYNFFTVRQVFPVLMNETEAASFYHLFPALLAAILISKRLIKGLGPVGWMLILYIAGILLFLTVGVTAGIARASLLRYVVPTRADVGLGLASIILCVMALVLSKETRKDRTSRLNIEAIVGSAAMTLVLLFAGRSMGQAMNGFPPTYIIVLASLLGGLASFLMLSGRTRSFCAMLAVAVIAAGGFFNPLSTSLDHIYKSELAREITRLNAEAEGDPLWICYGSNYPSVLVAMLGGRSVGGVHWPPQMSFWERIDPAGQYRSIYNNFSHVELAYERDERKILLTGRQYYVVKIGISPGNAALRSMGARYVLAMGESQSEIDHTKFPLLYKSEGGGFAIFEIPPSNGAKDEQSADDDFHIEATPWLRGALDRVDCEIISGWVWDQAHPDSSITIEILDGETLLSTHQADLFRPDVLAAGFGSGKYGFRIPTPAIIKDGLPHTIRARVAGSSYELIRSPVSLTCR
ncbi:MAG: hypothetical protein AB1631_09595 [Acidobacteriota bacterium]